MSTTRRAFLQMSAAVGCVFGPSVVSRSAFAQEQGGAAPADEGEKKPDKAAKPLKLLILGGTSFLGPAVVEYAIARGHSMTLFNRGKTKPHLFPDQEKLIGDRQDDLKALEGRDWDAVIDTSGYVPRHVTATASLLADHVQQYVFISSLSVYADNSVAGMDETSPVIELDQETLDSVQTIRETRPHYGGMKAHCEKEAEKAMPGRTTNIRPGLIVGRRDMTGRYPYWPIRIEKGGEVLAPGGGSDNVQYVDVRDLGEWIVKVIEDGTTGEFNAIGPEHPLTMQAMLYGIRAVTTAGATLTWVDADFLAEQQVQPWRDMPVWIPPRDGYEGFHHRSNKRAMKAGLTFRPVAATARDTLKWYHTLDPDQQTLARGPFTPEREAEVLAAWHARDEVAEPAEVDG